MRRSLTLLAVATALLTESLAAQCLVSRFPQHGFEMDIHSDATGTRIAIGPSSGETYIFDADSGDELFFVRDPDDDFRGGVALNASQVAIGRPTADLSYAGQVDVYNYLTGTFSTTLSRGIGFCDLFGRAVQFDEEHLIVSELDAFGVGFGHYYEQVLGAISSIGAPPSGPDAWPTNAAIGERQGRPVVAYGARDFGVSEEIYLYHYVTLSPTFLGTILVPGGAWSTALAEEHVAIGTATETRIYDVSSQALVTTLPVGGEATFSDGYLCVGSPVAGSGQIVIYDQATWLPVLTIPAPANTTDFGRDAKLAGARVLTRAVVNGVPETQVYAVPRPSNDLDGNGVHDACEWSQYCVAETNSTGQTASIDAVGSGFVNANDLSLVALRMPANQFGYFLMSASQGFLPLFGGSSGNLCLGAPILRFNSPPQGLVLNSGPTGMFSFQLDLTNLPQSTRFMPLETWYFQAWFRDGSTSNTTEGLAVSFQ